MVNNGTGQQEYKDKTYRILSLDGGGIRGLVTAVWLHRLEKELGAPLRDHFHLIAGTSTGSILACGVALGMPGEELIKIYKECGKRIFSPSPWPGVLRYIRGQIYSSKGLENVLQEKFKWKQFQKYNEGNLPLNCNSDNESSNIDLHFGDLYCLNKQEVTTVIISYDTLNRRAIPFNSSLPRYQEIPIWEICKASSSAPIYFPPHIMKMYNGEVSYEIPLIDGGVVASNPTACAIAEGMKVRPDLKRDQFVVVSLGTGDANRPIHINEIKKWGLLNWGRNFTNVFFDGVSQAVDHVASNTIAQDRYFRFQAKLQEDSMDDISEKNLNALQAFANSYFETTICRDKIKQLKDALSENSKVEPNEGLSKIDCQNGHKQLGDKSETPTSQY